MRSKLKRLWFMLILQLLCLSLCPTYGRRPSFGPGDRDQDEDHDHGEQEEDQVDDQYVLQDEDDNEKENEPTPLNLEACDGKSGKELEDCLMIWMLTRTANSGKGSSKETQSKPTKDEDDNSDD